MDLFVCTCHLAGLQAASGLRTAIGPPDCDLSAHSPSPSPCDLVCVIIVRQAPLHESWTVAVTQPPTNITAGTCSGQSCQSPTSLHVNAGMYLSDASGHVCHETPTGFSI